MKIAIPTNDKINIIYHLRFALGFMIFDIEEGKIQNKQYRKLAQMSGQVLDFTEDSYARVAQILTDCDLIILYAMNPKIEQEFNKANVEIFLASEADIQSSIKLFLQGKLLKLS
ncbi:MAG: NifB/NifX family molybdenum-iron cluster-binding protein [bacterium]|nr:NifB/NifX family molybdenum-iron cluster-binding protein [bacterium]